MRICVVTDEISADPETAIEIASAWGIRDFELRGFYYDRIPRISGHQKCMLRDALQRYDARVVAISPGLFKFPFFPTEPEGNSLPILDRAAYQIWEDAQHQAKEHLEELLPASIDFACEFGAGVIVTFGFGRGNLPDGPATDLMLEYLFKAAEQAKAAGLQLAVENEVGFWAGSASRTAEMIRQVDHPNLGINWDPGNAFVEGDIPYPDGYDLVKRLVRHVHFKDVTRDTSGKFDFATRGEIDWEGQIKTLAHDGYEGYISIETHMRPKIASAWEAFERIYATLSDGAGELE